MQRWLVVLAICAIACASPPPASDITRWEPAAPPPAPPPTFAAMAEEPPMPAPAAAPPTHAEEVPRPAMPDIGSGLVPCSSAAPSYDAPLPAGVAGLRFSVPESTFIATCAKGGFRVADASVPGLRALACLGAPAPLGFTVNFVRASFVRGIVCGLDVVSDPLPVGGNTSRTLRDIHAVLVQKYGEPSCGVERIPEACEGDRLDGCLLRKSAVVSYRWYLTGHKRWRPVIVLTARALSSGAARVEVDYTSSDCIEAEDTAAATNGL